MSFFKVVSVGAEKERAMLRNLFMIMVVLMSLSFADGRYWRAVASAADGVKLVAAETYGGGIWTSDDSGANWAQTDAPPGDWISVASSQDGVKLVAADANNFDAGNGYIWTSSDSGFNWIKSGSPGGTSWRSVASSDDGVHLAAVEFDSGGTDSGWIWISANSGATWTKQETDSDSNSLYVQYWQKVASSADGKKVVALADQGYIYTGTTEDYNTYIWTKRTTDTNGNDLAQKWWSLTCSKDGTKLVAVWADEFTNSGRAYTSFDGGVTWKPGRANKLFQDMAASADGVHVFAEVLEVLGPDTYQYRVYTSSSSGKRWRLKRTYSFTDLGVYASSADGMKLVRGQFDGLIYTSTNGASSWTEIDVDAPPP